MATKKLMSRKEQEITCKVVERAIRTHKYGFDCIDDRTYGADGTYHINKTRQYVEGTMHGDRRAVEEQILKVVSYYKSVQYYSVGDSRKCEENCIVIKDWQRRVETESGDYLYMEIYEYNSDRIWIAVHD